MRNKRRLLLVTTAWVGLALVSMLGALWFAAGVYGWHYCTGFSRRGDDYYLRCIEPRSSGFGVVLLATLGLISLALAIRQARAWRHS